MRAYGFQLVNTERSEVNISGGMAEESENSTRGRALPHRRACGGKQFCDSSAPPAIFRQSGFSSATMEEVIPSVPESNASSRSC
ncbi:hypothetical protein E0H54_31670 [Rhizobium leguminosarum bv. viciae]|nr:hypothetical protein CO654_30065 [Rhizobium sp. L18]TBY40992.1 hypothetical protein E0H54_31670 [Rhizobium leguminosarum bv. viciae]